MVLTGLELRQRGLLDLIKNRSVATQDSYLWRVAGSRELAMVRQIALWWRAFDLEAHCRLSVGLLKYLGRFHYSLAAYFDNTSVSPFAEELSVDFLAWLYADEDPLVRTVSAFERALLMARAGSSTSFEVLWDRNPELVVCALENGSEVPRAESDYVYRTVIARDLHHLVTCTREPRSAAR